MEMHSDPVPTPAFPVPVASSRAGFEKLLRVLCSPGFMAIALFVFSLALNTRHNDFPYTYHPDERGKALQITERSRNYHHPLLLLTATDFIMRLGGVDRTPQLATETGRWVSAAFAAGTVAALARIAFLLYGTVAGWAAGIVLAFQVDLYKTAHYMKEDPALVFGLALTLLAAHLWWRQPTRRRLLFFGFACGLAAAGKYLGIVSLIYAIPLVAFRSGFEGSIGKRLKSFVLVFAATFLLANTPFLVRLNGISSPFRSINHEVSGVAEGHHGLTRTIPHTVYFEKLRKSTPAALAVLSAAYAIAMLIVARRRSAVEWLTLLFPLVFVAMLSCSPKIADRYLLPVNVTFTFLGALGAAELARVVDARGSTIRHALWLLVLAGASAWLVASEIPPLKEAYAEYAADDHAVVAAWVRENLPADALLAEDHRVNLSASKADGMSSDARVPQAVLDADFAADLGSLDELRKKGVTHVVVCRDSYDRFFDKAMKPGKAEKADFDRRKTFYTELFAQGKLLKEWEPGKIAYLHPGMKLYELRPESPKSGKP